MRKTMLYMLGIIAVGSMTSCMMYHPHNVDIPLLEERGDLHVDAGVSVTPLFDGYGLCGSLSYAPVNRLGLQMSGGYSERQAVHMQGAVGSFVPLSSGVLEGYLGMAWGNFFQVHSAYAKFKSNMVFGQLNYGWNHLLDDKINLGFGVKGGVLHPYWNIGNTDDVDGKSCFLLEPQAVFRWGGPKVKFSFNVSYLFLNDLKGDENTTDYVPFSFGFGVHYKF